MSTTHDATAAEATPVERKRFWNLFEEASKLGPYDERPLLPEHVDPQLHASRNDRVQPFHLICEKDTMLATVAGEGAVTFKSGSVLRWHVRPGDLVYVPARTPHRIEPETELLQIRYKAGAPGFEAVAWYCESCGEEVWRSEFNTAQVLSQQAWWDATQQFNGDEQLRTCGSCGALHPAADLTGIRWPDVVDQIRDAVEVKSFAKPGYA